MNNRVRILTVGYLLLAASAVAYELCIRIFDRGNSEFAGLWSVVVTFPASLVLIAIGKETFGLKVGDSDILFVVFFGLSALSNACIVWMISSFLSRRK